MGKTFVRIELTNLRDLYEEADGRLPPEQVHRVAIDDALVDTGAYTLMLPTRVVLALGLKRLRAVVGTTAGAPTTFWKLEAVRLTIMGRDATLDAYEIPDTNRHVLVGQIPLEMLDLVVDPKNGRVILNPEHGEALVVET